MYKSEHNLSKVQNIDYNLFTLHSKSINIKIVFFDRDRDLDHDRERDLFLSCRTFTFGCEEPLSCQEKCGKWIFLNKPIP